MTDNPQTTELHDIHAPLSQQDRKQIEDECEEIQGWLRKKKCTCIEVRGENPACVPCQAIDLIDVLFGLIPKVKADA